MRITHLEEKTCMRSWGCALSGGEAVICANPLQSLFQTKINESDHFRLSPYRLRNHSQNITHGQRSTP